MHTRNTISNNPFIAPTYPASPGNRAVDGRTQATFSLLFEKELALSIEQCSSPESGDIAESLGLGLSGEDLLHSSSSNELGPVFDRSTAEPLTTRPGPQSPIPSPPGILDSSQTVVAVNRHSAVSGRLPDQSSANEVGLKCKSGSQPSVGASLNKGRLSDWMDAHALTRSSHHCARYCRQGMEAAGLDTTDRPQSGDAGDYGPFLLRHGAQIVSQNSYNPVVGDVIVFNKTGQHPFGHIEMYDGHRWVSDFKQQSLSPYRDAASAPPFTIYRLT